jgi:ABC-type transport system substrate-binding protein
MALSCLLMLSACGPPASDDPNATSRPTPPAHSPFPSAPPSQGVFKPMTYPDGAEAPCREAAAPDATHAPYRGTLRRIVAVDPRTVRFELCGPDVAFPAKVASASLVIDDTAWLQSKLAGDGTPAILGQANGTGPYRLGAWRRGADIELDRNDGFWGDEAAAPAAVFRWAKSTADRLDALRASSVDGIDTLDPQQVDSVSQDPDLEPYRRDGLNIAYLGMDASFAPFDRAGVRQAIAMGIDRAALVLSTFPIGSEVASHVNPCAIPDGCAGKDWYEFDALAAKDVMTAAGFAHGFKTTLSYIKTPRDYLPNPSAVAQAIADQLKASLDITVTLKPRDFEGFLADADAGRIDGLYLLGSRPRWPDASYLLDRHFGRFASEQFGPKYPDVTKALEDAASTTDPAARTKAYSKANDAIRRHAIMVPLAHVGSTVAFRADVEGVRVSPLGVDELRTVVPGDRHQVAYMQAYEPASLYCPDETDLDTLRVCTQIADPLYRTSADGATPIPALAEACTANPDLTVWTCTLRDDVRFHDGTRLDANDVVLSFAIQWDAEHPLHRGRTGTFAAFLERFGGFLHPPAGG